MGCCNLGHVDVAHGDRRLSHRSQLISIPFSCPSCFQTVDADIQELWMSTRRTKDRLTVFNLRKDRNRV